MGLRASYNSSTNGWILRTRVLMLFSTEARIQFLVFTRIELTTSALADVRGYLRDHSSLCDHDWNCFVNYRDYVLAKNIGACVR